LDFYVAYDLADNASLLAIGVLMALTLLITSGPAVLNDHDLRVIRATVFVSSWVGYAVIAIVMRLENSRT
jgi:hypothetical protein